MLGEPGGLDYSSTQNASGEVPLAYSRVSQIVEPFRAADKEIEYENRL